MKVRSFKLPDSIDNDLENEASRRGVTRSDILREALAEYLIDDDAKVSFLSAAGDLVGCLDGPEDLSSNPVYLDDFGR